MKIVFCIECGNRLPEGSRFCPRDGRAVPNEMQPVGAPVRTSAPPPPPPWPATAPEQAPVSTDGDTWSCRSCHWINPASAAVCPHCGKAPAIQTSAPEPVPVSTDGDTWSCRSCHWINPASAAVCPHCGKAPAIQTSLWLCRFCAQENLPAATSCSRCGTGALGNEKLSVHTAGAATPAAAGGALSTLAIILGVLAVLFIPIVLGPAAVILGAVAQSKGEKHAVVAIAVGACGTLVGLFLGALTALWWI